jgi:xyloglucan fucosyltransferase
MALVGAVSIGITKRPPQQCSDSDAGEKAAQGAVAKDTVEQDAKSWIARKKITTLAICLVVLPILVITASLLDATWTAESVRPLARSRRQGA